jgi:D-xylose transport system permease protein
VVTLAFFLGLQGVTLKLIGEGGSVRVDDPVIRGITIDNLPVTVGWICALLVVVGYAGLELYRHRSKVAAGLHHAPFGVVAARIVGVGAVTLGVTYLLSLNRSVNRNIEIRGIPYVLPLVGVLLIVLTFVLTRTAYGRHIYAVGGNAEAARRAGVNVDRIRMSVFVVCSALAAVSGIIVRRQGVRSLGSWQRPAVRGRRGGDRRHQPVRWQGPCARRGDRRRGGGDDRQRTRPAESVVLHQLPGHRRRPATGGQR